jgi:hypothetical protein
MGGPLFGSLSYSFSVEQGTYVMVLF